MVSKSGDRFLVVTADLEGNSFADYALEAIVETETPCSRRVLDTSYSC